MSDRSFAELADINPPLAKLPRDSDTVSFVAMADVSESGNLTAHHLQPFGRVKTGFTRFQDGDILFAKITPCMENGKGALVSGLEGGVGCGSTEFHVLRARSGNDPRYLYQWLQWSATRQKAQLLMSGSAGQQRVPAEFFRRFRIPARKAAIQQCIADVLCSLDEAREATEALTEKHQRIKSGLMHDLFTRGVMVNGKLRPPREAAPADYRKTEIGWIPVNWQVVPLSSASEFITSGSRGWSAYYSEDGATFIRIGNLTREHPNFRWDEVQKVAPPIGAEGARTKVAPGDVLVSITADLGICGVVSDDLPNAYVNQHIALVRPKLDVVNSRFVGHYMATHSAQSRLQQSNDSGAKAGLNLKAVGEFKIPLPSDPRESAAIASTLDGVDTRIRALRASVEKLRAQKLGLMQDLLTGKVAVRVPEPAIPA